MAGSRPNAIPIVIALMSAEILGVFEVTMLFAAMRHLIAEFGNPVTVGWLFTSFALTSAVSAAIGARLGDLFGRRRLLLASISLGFVGSLVAGISTDISGVILGRVLQGTSGAIFPLCIGLVRENVQAARAPVAIGALTATVTISAGAALVMGGVIVDQLSWRWIFFAGAGAALVAVTLVTLLVPPSRSGPTKGGVNYAGGLLFAPALAAVLLAVTFSRDWGWTDLRIWSLLLGGGVLLAGWVVSELRAKVPLIDVRLLANRQVALANLVFVLLALTVMQMNLVASLLLQQPTWTGVGLGITATLAGLVLLPASLISFIGGPGSGWMVARFGGKPTMKLGSVLLIAGWVGLAFNHGSWLAVGLWITVAGLGMSVVYSVVPMLIIDSTPMERTSEAIGIPTVVRSAFMGVGAQVVAFLLATSEVADRTDSAKFPDADAFFAVFCYFIAGVVLILLVSMLLPRRPGTLQSSA